MEHRLRTSEGYFQLIRIYVFILCSQKRFKLCEEHERCLCFLEGIRRTPENNIGQYEILSDEFHSLCAIETEKREILYEWEKQGKIFAAGVLLDVGLG